MSEEQLKKEYDAKLQINDHKTNNILLKYNLLSKPEIQKLQNRNGQTKNREVILQKVESSNGPLDVLDSYNKYFQEELNNQYSSEKVSSEILPFIHTKSREQLNYSSALDQSRLLPQIGEVKRSKSILSKREKSRKAFDISGFEELRNHEIKNLNQSMASRNNMNSHRNMLDSVRKMTLKYDLSNTTKDDTTERTINIILPNSESQEQSNFMSTSKIKGIQFTTSSLNIKMLDKISWKLDQQEISFQQVDLELATLEFNPEQKFRLYQQYFQVYQQSLFSMTGILQNNESLILGLFQRLMNGLASSQNRLEKLFNVINETNSQQQEAMRLKISKLESDLTKVRSQLLEESVMFTEERKQMLEKQVKDFLSQKDTSGIKIDDNVKHILTYQELRDKLLQVLDKSQYSGVKDTLNEVFTILNFYQHVQREMQYESQRIGDKEVNIENHDIILDAMQEDMDEKFKIFQRGTAKKVLQRFYRNIKTKEHAVQTMPEESLVIQLQEMCAEKDDEIRIQKDQLLQQALSLKDLEDKLSKTTLRCEQLNIHLRQKEKALSDLSAQFDEREIETTTLRTKNKDIMEDNHEFKKRIDKLSEEISKMRVAMHMQKKMMTMGMNSEANNVRPEESQQLQKPANPLLQLITATQQSQPPTSTKGKENEQDDYDDGYGSEANQSSSQKHQRKNSASSRSNAYQSQGGSRQSRRIEKTLFRASGVQKLTDHREGKTQSSVQQSSLRAPQITSEKLVPKDNSSLENRKPKESTNFIKIDNYGEITIGTAAQEIKQQIKNSSNGKPSPRPNQSQIVPQNEKAGLLSIPKIDKQTKVSITNQYRKNSNQSQNNNDIIQNLAQPLSELKQLTERGIELPRFKNDQLVRSLTRGRKGFDDQDDAYKGTEGNISARNHNHTIHHSSSQGEMKTLTMTELSVLGGITKIAMPPLYIAQKPIVTLQKFKDEMDDTDHMIKRLLETQRNRKINREEQKHGCDKEVQVAMNITPQSYRESTRVIKSVQTQTKMTGPVLQVPMTQNKELQVNAVDIEREIKRDELYLKNVSRLYGSLNFSRLIRDYSPNEHLEQRTELIINHSSLSPHRKQAHSKINIGRIIKQKQSRNTTDFQSQTTRVNDNLDNVHVQNAVSGGDAFTKYEDQHQGKNVLFFDQHEPFKVNKIV